MVVGVGPITTVESLQQVVDTVVVVVKVSEVVNTVVVVVASPGFFKEGGVRGNGSFQHRKVNDDTCRNAGVRPHEVAQCFVSHVVVTVVNAVPSTLTALVGGLYGCLTEATAFNELGGTRRFRSIVDGLNNGE